MGPYLGPTKASCHAINSDQWTFNKNQLQLLTSMGAHLRQQSTSADVTVLWVIVPVASQELPEALVGLIDPELVQAGCPLPERDLGFPAHASRSVSCHTSKQVESNTALTKGQRPLL